MNRKGVTDFIKSFRESVKGDTASEEEVLARTRVCLKCPKRKKITRGMVASQVSRRAGLFANKNNVDPKIKDYACGVCYCSLILLIPTKDKAPHQDTPDQAAKRPSSCWFEKNSD